MNIYGISTPSPSSVCRGPGELSHVPWPGLDKSRSVQMHVQYDSPSDLLGWV